MLFADRAYDEKLAMEICKRRSRPEIPANTKSIINMYN
jgi:hypothetical protein